MQQMELTPQCAKLQDVIDSMAFEGKVLEYRRYGSGHINDTFLVTCQFDDYLKQYILQRINQHVFKQPKIVMRNILRVTEFLSQQTTRRRGNAQRECLNLVLTKEGKPYYIDELGNCWRGYLFIDGASCLDRITDTQEMYECGKMFGRFQELLGDLPADELEETIPDFHNPPKRFEAFLQAVAEDKMGRAASVRKEIDFVCAHKDDMAQISKLLESGQMPLRVVHNDTKCNNILIDDRTHKCICVIDLDTVMPGLAVYDYGDAIRYAASEATEDEPDLSKVRISLPLFDAYTRGYMEACANSLTKCEIDSLVLGAQTIAYEIGMRFLMDHINGDIYFRIHRENHNLDRARAQLTIARDIGQKWDQLQRIVDQYR